MLQLVIALSVAALVGIDQLTKWLAIKYLKGNASIPVIDKVFELTYLENTGAAFGFGKDHDWMRWVFIILTLLVLVVLTIVLMSGRYRQYKLVNISGILIIAGGIGNMIDRLFRGYVIDFLYFRLIDFPVFNFADCCVVIGAILLLIFLFFIYSDDKTEKPSKQAVSPSQLADSASTDEPSETVQSVQEEVNHGTTNTDATS